MTARFALTVESAGAVVTGGLTEGALRYALEAYPGAETAETVLATGGTPAELLAGCVERMTKSEGPLVTSFLLRLIERRFREGARDRAALGVPALISAEPALAGDLDGLAGDWTVLAARLCAALGRARADRSDADQALVDEVHNRLDALRMAEAAIAQMADLKAAHDALHALQVIAATADPAAPADARRALLAPLLAGARGQLQALPVAAEPPLPDTLSGLALAEGLLGDVATVPLAEATLREVLRAQMPALDAVLFDRVARWPLRALTDLLRAAEAAGLPFRGGPAAGLHDGLLRRMLVHAQWQLIDSDLHGIEALLAPPRAPDWFARLHRALHPLERGFERVAADRRQPLPPDALRTAVTAYAARPDDPAREAAVLAEAAALAATARTRFRAVDLALLADLRAFETLRACLRGVIDRVDGTAGTGAPPAGGEGGP